VLANGRRGAHPPLRSEGGKKKKEKDNRKEGGMLVPGVIWSSVQTQYALFVIVPLETRRRKLRAKRKGRDRLAVPKENPRVALLIPGKNALHRPWQKKKKRKGRRPAAGDPRSADGVFCRKAAKLEAEGGEGAISEPGGTREGVTAAVRGRKKKKEKKGGEQRPLECGRRRKKKGKKKGPACCFEQRGSLVTRGGKTDSLALNGKEKRGKGGGGVC